MLTLNGTGGVFLSQLQISGFKSFGSRANLKLEPGITAIVGPNGSGKSNVADAIRWAMGEQSAKSLRLKKSDDIVFVGTDKKARASLAEVSLTLDNHDGGLAIDFSEVEITRRLYGNGDSDYLLNGKKARLADIQQLLAAAGFGPNSYSVIGQGMIDSFIMASPTERKQLFDDASGIRQFELKREQALKKLSDTETNLVRAGDILAELAPRLNTLERAVGAAAVRIELESELERHRRRYIATALNHQVDIIDREQRHKAEIEAAAKDWRRDIAVLEKQREAIQTASLEQSGEKDRLQADLAEAEQRRDELTEQVGAQRVELQFLVEKQEAASGVPLRLQELRRQLAGMHSARGDLERKLERAQSEEQRQTEALEKITLEISQAQKELSKTRRQVEQANGQDFVRHALELVRQLARQLSGGDIDRAQLNLVVHKIGRLLSHATGVGPDMAEVKQMQARLTLLMNRREELHEQYTATVIQVRSLELDLTYNADRTSQLAAQLEETKAELQDLDLPSPQDIKKKQKVLAELEQELPHNERTVARLRQELATSSRPVGTEAVFELAAKLEAAKSELAARVAAAEAATSSIERAKAETKRFQVLGRDWFGQHPQPADEPDGSLEQLERDLSTIEARLAATGAADAEAEAEYHEVKQRHDFLAHQIDDLQGAKADLLKVVEQLDGLIKDRFEAAFKDISGHFDNYFQRIFGGGRARLSLVRDDDQVYGIEIQASPPGKRVQSLAMLSGGEKALTGIALLAAILAVSPSPFVVLDEVDAALDEANSARFADILREVAAKSQIVVITHNRQTMGAAKVLYGVTMDDQQVSKLLSVRLEQAVTLAAR